MNDRRKSYRLQLAMLLAVTLLVAAACGGSDDNNDQRRRVKLHVRRWDIDR